MSLAAFLNDTTQSCLTPVRLCRRSLSTDLTFVALRREHESAVLGTVAQSFGVSSCWVKINLQHLNDKCLFALSEMI